MANKNVDKAKGRAKEAAGALSGNKRLKAEGRVDQAKGSLKNAADKAADAVTPASDADGWRAAAGRSRWVSTSTTSRPTSCPPRRVRSLGCAPR